MRKLHIVLLSLAIALTTAGTSAWARGAGGHGGGGGFHGGGGFGGGGFRGGYGGGGFRGGYGGFRGGYGGWGWGYGFGWGWPSAYGPYYGYYGYPYYPYYPDYSYYPGYSHNPCQPYGPYNCGINGNGPASYQPSVAPAGPPRSSYDPGGEQYSPSPYTQQSAATQDALGYVGDGQWHHFGPRPGPASRIDSRQETSKPDASQPIRTYKASLVVAQ